MTMPTLSAPTASMVNKLLMLVDVKVILAWTSSTTTVISSPRSICVFKSPSTEAQVWATAAVWTTAVATTPALTRVLSASAIEAIVVSLAVAV